MDMELLEIILINGFSMIRTDQLISLYVGTFRQAVFANMRAGEPIVERDLPLGSDIMGEITSNPRATELMEFELFSRLEASGRQELIGSHQHNNSKMLLLAEVLILLLSNETPTQP